MGISVGPQKGTFFLANIQKRGKGIKKTATKVTVVKGEITKGVLDISLGTNQQIPSVLRQWVCNRRPNACSG